MKSAGRQNDLRKSISKRTVSSIKLSKNLIGKQISETTSVMGRSHTIKQITARTTKINNFLDNIQIKISNKSSKMTQRKHRTAKLITKNAYQQFLLKKSDKMKLLYWNNDANLLALNKIVISADFVMNQDSFWEKGSKIEDQILLENKGTNRAGFEGIPLVVKDWKVLHKLNFVIWTVRTKRTILKLEQLVSNFGLALHAIFFIKKRKSYTIDFTAIQKQIQKERLFQASIINENLPLNSLSLDMKMQRPQALTIFQTIKINTKDIVNYSSYAGKVPILIGNAAKVVFMRVEDTPGLQLIVKCLERWRNEDISIQRTPSSMALNRYQIHSARNRPVETHLLSSIKCYVSRYMINSHRFESEMEQYKDNESDWQYEQEDIQKRIETMKRDLVSELIEDHGRNHQFEGGSSIHNFVGEMFKRNYRILSDRILFEMGVSHRKQRRSQPCWSQEQLQVDLRVDYYEMTQR